MTPSYHAKNLNVRFTDITLHLRRGELMRKKNGLPVIAGILMAILCSVTSSLHAEPYELSKNDVMESKEISSASVSLSTLTPSAAQASPPNSLSIPAMILISVDLPAPFSPKSA